MLFPKSFQEYRAELYRCGSSYCALTYNRPWEPKWESLKCSPFFTVLFAAHREAELCVKVAEAGRGERDVNLSVPLCGSDASAAICREPSAFLDELDKFYLPVLCARSLLTTSLEQFRCSVIVLRTFCRVCYSASTEPWWFFSQAVSWPAFQRAPAVGNGYLGEVRLADPKVRQSRSMYLRSKQTVN